MKKIQENPYLLLTPGPLSTSATVKQAMLRDWCTWDNEYNGLVEEIRDGLLEIAEVDKQKYTSVLMQGSGTFVVESVIGSVIPEKGKLLVLANGTYGQRIATIATYLKIETVVYDSGELSRHDLNRIDTILAEDKSISHVAVVHCETTTGMLNLQEEIGKIVSYHKLIYILDAMSSFGGIPINIEKAGISFLISSANKCIQGVPGFGFVIAERKILEASRGNARSLSLDLFDQWNTMETLKGKWRFTSPTHVVRAFRQAMIELKEEGGVKKRFERYTINQKTLVSGMARLGFKPLLYNDLHSPIITTFISPKPPFEFEKFYYELKEKGFVIYPGKVTDFQCFRIGNIGEIDATDIKELLTAIEQIIYWR